MSRMDVFFSSQSWNVASECMIGMRTLYNSSFCGGVAWGGASYLNGLCAKSVNDLPAGDCTTTDHLIKVLPICLLHFSLEHEMRLLTFICPIVLYRFHISLLLGF